ncbi:MAG: hypothetical protein ACRD7E_04930 [Bryobacteraceae bacterium]
MNSSFQIPVGLLERTCARYTQALHQPVLRREKCPLDPSLRLWTVRRNPGDLQFAQRPSDLCWRQRLALLSRQDLLVPDYFRGGLKQARFVGVERHRPAIPLYVPPQQPQVLFRRVVPRKSRRQLARSVVDHRDQI